MGASSSFLVLFRLHLDLSRWPLPPEHAAGVVTKHSCVHPSLEESPESEIKIVGHVQRDKEESMSIN